MVHFSASDGISGISEISPDITISTEGVGLSATGTVVDGAGNTASFTVTGINIDKTPPQIEIRVPVDAGEYRLNDNIPADWLATDGLSGIASVSGTVPSGQAIDTGTAGTKSFQVTAADCAENQATRVLNYNVVSPEGYIFDGFLPPIKNDGSSSFNLGRSVPVKFRLIGAGGRLRGRYDCPLVPGKDC